LQHCNIATFTKTKSFLSSRWNQVGKEIQLNAVSVNEKNRKKIYLAILKKKQINQK